MIHLLLNLDKTEKIELIKNVWPKKGHFLNKLDTHLTNLKVRF